MSVRHQHVTVPEKFQVKCLVVHIRMPGFASLVGPGFYPCMLSITHLMRLECYCDLVPTDAVDCRLLYILNAKPLYFLKLMKLFRIINIAIPFAREYECIQFSILCFCRSQDFLLGVV